MKKVIITEGQYRLIKENDEGSYESVADFLLNPDINNRIIGLYMIKHNQLDLSKIVDKLLIKREMSTPQNIHNRLKKFQGRTFLKIDLIENSVSMHIGISKIHILNVKIRLEGSEEYVNQMDLNEGEEVYFDFFEDVIDNFKDKLILAIQKDIDNLPE